jgi:hypothetical protein
MRVHTNHSSARKKYTHVFDVDRFIVQIQPRFVMSELLVFYPAIACVARPHGGACESTLTIATPLTSTKWQNGQQLYVRMELDTSFLSPLPILNTRIFLTSCGSKLSPRPPPDNCEENDRACKNVYYDTKAAVGVNCKRVRGDDSH